MTAPAGARARRRKALFGHCTPAMAASPSSPSRRRVQRRFPCLRYPALSIRPQRSLCVDRSPAGNVPAIRPDELERRLRVRLDALGPALRAELLHVLTLPDFERAERIGAYWGNPKTRTFAELPIDCEEDRVLRAVLVGMLCEGWR
jgi:hypothetical protein